MARSWVLILQPRERRQNPAIIGGYATQEEADEAGRAAVKPPEGQFRHWASWSVIAGQASIAVESAPVPAPEPEPAPEPPPAKRKGLLDWFRR